MARRRSTADKPAPARPISRPRSSRNVLLTLLGAGVAGGVLWASGSGSDCADERYATREACEQARGSGACMLDAQSGQWRPSNCGSSYRPRTHSGYWPGYGSAMPRRDPGYARPGTSGRVDAPPRTSGRSGTTSPGTSRRGGFGSIGSSRSGS
jgi:hypothetical protein